MILFATLEFIFLAELSNNLLVKFDIFPIAKFNLKNQWLFYVYSEIQFKHFFIIKAKLKNIISMILKVCIWCHLTHHHLSRYLITFFIMFHMTSVFIKQCFLSYSTSLNSSYKLIKKYQITRYSFLLIVNFFFYFHIFCHLSCQLIFVVLNSLCLKIQGQRMCQKQTSVQKYWSNCLCKFYFFLQ